MSNIIRGIVFNIEKYSVHDGPGIRTLVFLKGCPLSCLWCCNPESQKVTSELIFFPENCIECGACKNSCPNKAINIQSRELIIDVAKCTLCMKCVEECYSNALRSYGKKMTVNEVLMEVEKDLMFYQISGGGLTISGGEPFVQHVFLRELLTKSRKHGINNAVETCGYVASEIFDSMIPLIDVFLFDLKHMDNTKHEKLTGMGNEIIHKNFSSAVKSGKDVIPRMPLIPTLNDSPENLQSTCKFIKSHGLNIINILPYHELGISKYKKLGREYSLNLQIYTNDKLVEIKKFVESQGMKCMMY